MRGGLPALPASSAVSASGRAPPTATRVVIRAPGHVPSMELANSGLQEACDSAIARGSPGRLGGWSWSIPYLAGAYCLAAQVHPSITPEEFWALALKTGRTTRIEQGGKQLPLGPILDPTALIDALGSAH